MHFMSSHWQKLKLKHENKDVKQKSCHSNIAFVNMLKNKTNKDGS